MAIFSGDIFLTCMDLTISRQIPFLVFERVSTKTKNRVSFWALRSRGKIKVAFLLADLNSDFAIENSMLFH